MAIQINLGSSGCPQLAVLSREACAAPAAQVSPYLESARARNTIRGYASDWKQFQKWCLWRGVNTLPAFPETIALYLSENAGRLKAGTLDHHLAAVTKAHRAAGLPSPARESFLVSETLKSVKRVHGSAVAQKDPYSRTTCG